MVNAPIILSYGVVPDDNGGLICETYRTEIGQRIFATFFFFAYILPLLVIAIFSIFIVRHISRQKPSTLADKKSKSADKKKKAGRMLILVVVIFAILWLPIHLHLLFAYFWKIPEEGFYTLISWLWNVLAYFNSCVNPIIYNHTSKLFRDAFREVATCGLGRRSAEVVSGATGNARRKTSGIELGKTVNNEPCQNKTDATRV